MLEVPSKHFKALEECLSLVGASENSWEFFEKYSHVC